MEATAVVLFTDVRGFTSWAEENEASLNLEEFATGLVRVIKDHFPEPFFIKTLGDGAMIVDDTYSMDEDPQLRLADILGRIVEADRAFVGFCNDFSGRIGHPVDFRLGWSVVRGQVRKVEGDYISHNINKAARLCDIARPSGIVIDYDDFPALPQELPTVPFKGLYGQPDDEMLRFYKKMRILRGIDKTRVWVTSEIQNEFVPREFLREQPEVHIAGACVRATGRKLEILLTRRSSRRQLYPGKWEGCGGQLAPNESFADGVRRHFKRELCLDVRVLEAIHCFYKISEPNTPLIPGIRFLCELEADSEPQISTNHSEAIWVSESQLKKMPDEDFVPNLKREISQLLRQHKAALPK